MRAPKLSLFLITATLFQTPIVHAEERHLHKIALQTHLHHLEAPILGHHPSHLQLGFQSLAGEAFAPQPSTFSLASYFISLFGHNR